MRSHFLVKEGIRKKPEGGSNPTLSIDRIDKTSGRWKRANILVFNTGHWWTHGKTARGYVCHLVFVIFSNVILLIFYLSFVNKNKMLSPMFLL